MSTTADLSWEMLRLAEADPGRLVVLASEVTERARAEGDVALESIAERAWGVAAVHLQDLETATRHFRAAIRLGRRAGSAELAAEALIRLAFVTSLRGRPKQALNEIGRALPDLHGVARARAEAQRAAVFNHLGRLDDALACYRTAVPVLRRAGDHLWLQRVLSNRGIVHGYRHEFGAAESDLREAEKLCRALGLDLSLAIVRLNLGWVSALRGDVPAALNRLDLAEGRFRALGTHQLGWLLSDRAGLLLSVGLVAEARQAAQEAVEELQHRHRKIGLPEVRLLLARAALLQGDHEHSQREARRAVSEFTRQHRPEWAALARFVVLRSRITHGVESQAVVGALERSAIALTAAAGPPCPWRHGCSPPRRRWDAAGSTGAAVSLSRQVWDGFADPLSTSPGVACRSAPAPDARKPPRSLGRGPHGAACARRAPRHPGRDRPARLQRPVSRGPRTARAAHGVPERLAEPGLRLGRAGAGHSPADEARPASRRSDAGQGHDRTAGHCGRDPRDAHGGTRHRSARPAPDRS
ncbi:tetratricopeptide repeat protein [Streptosporangium lutulentum]